MEFDDDVHEAPQSSPFEGFVDFTAEEGNNMLSVRREWNSDKTRPCFRVSTKYEVGEEALDVLVQSLESDDRIYADSEVRIFEDYEDAEEFATTFGIFAGFKREEILDYDFLNVYRGSKKREEFVGVIGTENTEEQQVLLATHELRPDLVTHYFGEFLDQDFLEYSVAEADYRIASYDPDFS